MSDVVTMAHGGGGRALRFLLEQHIQPAVGALALQHDAAVLRDCGPSVAFTTDSFVVNPLDFPGGDIGHLAVCGTVNDLAMAGATPIALSLALILEEGLPLADLDRYLASAAAAAAAANVRIVTGDTKVVERGRGHGLYINTAGVGRVPPGVDIGPHRLEVGDVVLVSGDLGRHGAAILSVREGLGFSGALPSDAAPLGALVAELLQAAPVHCLRDPTRGGLAAVLEELAHGFDIVVAEANVPVHATVRAATELLGLDPLQLACEGRLVAFVPQAHAADALAVLQRHDPAAAQIGQLEAGPGGVWLQDAYGGTRMLHRPWGDPLPRIC